MLRQAGFGLHFILGQTRPACARSSTQTLGVVNQHPMRTVLALLLVLCSGANAQSFVYELFEVGEAGRSQISAGTVTYGSDQAASSRPQSDGSRITSRELLLTVGFAIGCTDYGEKQPDGFGCWLARRPSQVSGDQYDGFSWEWYDHGVGTLYEKRKGHTKASLSTSKALESYAMSSLEFLDDTVFQVNMNPKVKPGTYTHELLVRKGSVLAFAPRQ